ncbi:MAG: hypothetical protein KAJ03_01640 [Gammaproteobacteria bacterium]|nr:hypothetical protein [Gammaproteobacteria bacterium]
MVIATINGVEFILSSLVPSDAIGHSQTNSPGSDTNPITYNGRGGLRISITGLTETRDEYDNVITEFKKAGEQTLIANAGWELRIYAATSTIPPHNTARENEFAFSLEMLTTAPYQYSAADTESLKTITSNNQTWSASDAAVDITTAGKVATVPDIAVTGAIASTLKISQTNKCS